MEPLRLSQARWAIFGLTALWAALFVAAVVVMQGTPPTDSGFTRGLNRIGVFFQWQAASFAVAALSFAITRSARLHLRRGMRWLGYGPLVIDLSLLGLLVILYVGAVLFARL